MPPWPGAMLHWKPAMLSRPRRHIRGVSGRNVRQPVFVIGAPHAGADRLTRTLKRTPGFHFTVGQPSVLSVVYAFACSPTICEGRGEAAGKVWRDAFAKAWQVTAHACLTCLPECQGAVTGTPAGTCVDERAIRRYGDASPALIYSAEGLLHAFPDARIVQIVRDGRAVVAAMLADPQELAWFRPGVANADSEFPNPFFRIETEADRAPWSALSAARKSPMPR